MAIYKSPGVYFTENIQALGSTNTGFNRTAVIGVAQAYTTISNLEIVKSSVAIEKSKIVISDVDPLLGETPVQVNDYVSWTNTTPVAAGSIELPVVKAHWIGFAEPSIGDYVILVDTDTEYGYKESVEGETGALKIVAAIAGNGYSIVESSTQGSLKVIAAPVDTDKILLPDGTDAEAGDITEVVGVGNVPSFYNYVLGTDYTLDSDNTTITWISSNRPVKSSTFYVTYKLNKSSERGDFNPTLLFNQTSIQQVYGPEYLNGVVQPLSLAADLVLEGQTLVGGGVYCVQVEADTEAAYKAAIDKLDKINVQTVIILKQDSLTLRNYLIQKIESCSSSLYGKERTTFIVPNSNSLSVDAIVAQRAGLQNRRISYFANKKVNILLTDYNTKEDSQVELSAIYACCNLSGIEGNPEYGYSEPMLRKTLSSRITLDASQIFDPSERNYLCANYLSAFDFNENTNLTYVFDLYTTDSENVITESRSVIRVEDLLKMDLRTQLNMYIGQKNTGSVASSAQVKTESILANYVQAQEIADYRNVTAAKDPTNPKQLNISLEFLPLFEVKYVQVELNISIN